MHLTRIDPFRELEALSNRWSRLLGGPGAGFSDEGQAFGEWMPAMDVEETDKEYLVKADLPAMRREDVKVGITDGILSLEGERRQEKDEHNRKFHRVERSYGKFVRRVSVPSDVDQGKVSADFKDGVLHIHLPKSPAAVPRSVAVQIN